MTNYKTTTIELNEEGYSFKVVNTLSNSIVNEYIVDINEDVISWYSNFDSGIKFFKNENEANQFAMEKIYSLKLKAVSTEISIQCS